MSDTARLDYVLSRFEVKRKRGKDEYDVLCPVHGDKQASAGIRLSNSGSILINCMAGCTTEDIVSAAGLEWKDLFPPDDNSFERDDTVKVAEYIYTDSEGVPLFKVIKLRDQYGKKSFRQQAADGKGGWLPNLGTATRVPYQLPEVRRAASNERRVLIVEGEKDVETLRKHGLVATTTPGGSGGWRPQFAEYFKGAEVIVIPDNDAPGKKYAKAICTDLKNAKVLDLPGLKEKEDVSDWLVSHKVDELLTLLGPESVEMNPCNWIEFQAETDRMRYLCGDIIAAQTVNIMVADAGLGKGGSVDTTVLSRYGWIRMGDLVVGDKIIGGTDGSEVTVTGVYPRGVLAMYRVTFSDGASVLCDGDHLWRVSKRTDGGRNSDWFTVDTATLKREHDESESNPFAIPHTPIVRHLGDPFWSPPLDPYLLGTYLGDGSSATTGSVTIADSDPDVCYYWEINCPRGDVVVPIGGDNIGVRVNGNADGRKRRSQTARILDDLGLTGKRSHEKFIPDQYLYSALHIRRDLLAGILDTDGSVGVNNIEYSSASKAMADGVVFLARSLGMRATEPTVSGSSYLKDGERHICRDRYRTVITVPDDVECPVYSSYNKNRFSLMTRARNMRGRRIVSVEPVGGMECVCIKVDDPGQLYLTDGLLVTHNTTLIAQMCLSLASGRPFLGIGVPGPIPVLLLEAEGARPIFRERAELCRKSMGLDHSQLQRWFIQSKDLDDFRLSHVTLERQIKMSGAKLVVLDTLGYFLLPGDENSSKDWKEFVMEPLRYLKRKYDCAFILIHHEGKPAEGKIGHHRGRGTSAMFGDCDTWMSLEKRNFSDDDLTLILENDGREVYDRIIRERRLVWSKSKVGRFPAPIMMDFDFDNAIFRRKEFSEKVSSSGNARRRFVPPKPAGYTAPSTPDPDDPFGA